MGAAFRILMAVTLAVLAACGNNNGAPPADEPQVPERDVSFATHDGLTLTGRLFGEGRVGVVLAHMAPADAESWFGPARRVAQAGYMALAFNFRGYAGSEGERAARLAPRDIAAASDFLVEQGVRDLVYVGASMGGTASIIAADEQDPLAIVAISAPLRFQGLDAPFVATRVQRPVLLIAARGDEEAFGALGELERALPNPDTLVYDGGAHGTNLLVDRPEAVDEIITFLRRYAPLEKSLESPAVEE